MPCAAYCHSLIIGTPERFHCGKQIGTYVGMIPSEDSSGGKQRLGHISKQGNSLLRFLLVEAAQAAARINPVWRRRYMHLAMRGHKSIAKVALGRFWVCACTGCGGTAASIRRRWSSVRTRDRSVAANRHPGQVGYSHSPPQEVRDEESSFRADPGKEGEG